MTKRIFTAAGIIAAFALMIVLPGCKKGPVTTIDESGYLGTYYGNHYLADSQSLRQVIGDPTANMVYPDTIVITNGSSTTDGKVSAKSTLLGGNSIEIDVTNSNITPVNLGNIVILSTTLKDCKLPTGSTGVWSADKSTVSTHLLVDFTYVLNGTDISGLSTHINGSFVKQP